MQTADSNVDPQCVSLEVIIILGGMEAEIKLFLFPGSPFACLGEESNLTVFEIY